MPGDQEHGSLKSTTLQTILVNNHFNALVTKKEEASTVKDSETRKRPFLNNGKDQFFQVATKPNSKPAVDAFFRELNATTKPCPSANPTPKKIPYYHKKEDAFQALYENNVAYVKAAWYIKIVAAYTASLPDSKVIVAHTILPNWRWIHSAIV